MTPAASSLPYHDPSTTTVLALAAFVLACHLSSALLAASLNAGLLGPILAGIAFGVPAAGTALLSLGFQEAVVLLGYVGLVLMIYDAGLGTDVSILRRRARESVCVAATGIVVPVGASFVLLKLVYRAEVVGVLASGIALCSTSLGTTVEVIKGVRGREGAKTVLLGAAMMDDVVGLVGIAVVQSLGGEGEVSAGRVVRPIAASVGLGLVTVGAVWVAGKVRERRMVSVKMPERWMVYWGFAWQGVVLLGLLAAAGYAGSSMLFAAFLAGASVGWWDARQSPMAADAAGGIESISEQKVESELSTASQRRMVASPTGSEIFEVYFRRVTDYLLIPFFFASIGFSIPITNMFTGEIVWKGLIYSILMTLAKLVTGAWLLVFKSQASPETSSEALAGEEQDASTPRLFPALLVGLAMVARGEIGFLIASVAESSGVYEGSPGLYLVTVWAIVVCTVLGPMGVGALVRWEQRRGKR